MPILCKSSQTLYAQNTCAGRCIRNDTDVFDVPTGELFDVNMKCTSHMSSDTWKSPARQ